MAGHRRGTGRPKQSALRAQRRRQQLAVELAEATTLGGQLQAACDYLRGAIKHASSHAAEQTVHAAISDLTARGDALYRNQNTADERRSA